MGSKPAIGRAKRGHEMSLSNWIKETPSAFLQCIKKRIGPLRDKGGSLCLESGNVDEVQNKNFASAFTEEKGMEDSEEY